MKSLVGTVVDVYGHKKTTTGILVYDGGKYKVEDIHSHKTIVIDPECVKSIHTGMIVLK